MKLARALWIVPLSLVTAIITKSKARIHWPWFIGFFCLAAVANTYVPQLKSLYPALAHLGVTGLTVTLFLIGTGLSKATLREVGIRPLLQGVLLWAIVGLVSLQMIRMMEAKSGNQIQAAQEEAKALLRQRHHLAPAEDNDFSIRNMQEIFAAQEASSRILSIMRLGSHALASYSYASAKTASD